MGATDTHLELLLRLELDEHRHGREHELRDGRGAFSVLVERQCPRVERHPVRVSVSTSSGVQAGVCRKV